MKTETHTHTHTYAHELPLAERIIGEDRNAHTHAHTNYLKQRIIGEDRNAHTTNYLKTETHTHTHTYAHEPPSAKRAHRGGVCAQPLEPPRSSPTPA